MKLVADTQHEPAAARLLNLTEMKIGERGRVAYLRDGSSSHMNKLLAMGVLPGVEVELRRTSPAFVFLIGFTQYAVDEQVATDIIVELHDPR